MSREGQTSSNKAFKFMLTILNTVAEVEHELTVERIREGMAQAKHYGNRSGRPMLTQITRGFGEFPGIHPGIFLLLHSVYPGFPGCQGQQIPGAYFLDSAVLSAKLQAL